MIKKIFTTGILFIILATLVVPVGVSAICPDGKPGTIAPDTGQEICDGGQVGNGGRATGLGGIVSGLAEAASYNIISESIAQFIGATLQRLSGLVLLVSGLLFDKVVTETVVNMSQNIGPGSGIGTSIQDTWGTLRDIANMVFIFVLLYTAFNYMFSVGAGNVGRNIAWIIIIALVINFSLFFSKVVIDASNVVSLGFYKSISNAGAYTVKLENGVSTTTPASTNVGFTGISAGYMRMLGLHTFWSGRAGEVSGAQNILIIGILSAIFVLIASVILIIMSVMFAARFVILIFIMILSPIAFVAYIIPGMSGRFNEWWNALINQSFFAPVFFGLTWVVFKIGGSQNFLSTVRTGETNWTAIVSAPGAAMGIVINYVIIIGFSIFALTASKKMASSVSQFASVSGAIGGVAIGGAAILGRNTIGRKALSVANDKELRDRAAAGNLGARMKLWTAGQAAGSSFDIRSIGGTGVGKSLGLDKGMDALGKAGGKGGFTKAIEDKAKAKVDYAKKYYAQTAAEKEELERARDAEKSGIRAKRQEEFERAEEKAKEAEKKRREYANTKLKPINDNYNSINQKKQEIERELAQMGESEAKEEDIKSKQESLDAIVRRLDSERELKKEAEKDMEENDSNYIDLKKTADKTEKERKEKERLHNKKEIDDDEYSQQTRDLKDKGKKRMKDFAERIKKGPLGIGFIGRMQGNQEAARKVIEAAEGKDKKNKKEMEKFLKDQGILDKDEDKTESTEVGEDKK